MVLASDQVDSQNVEIQHSGRYGEDWQFILKED